jgi:endogenous inhibitor of DNA gyrase (YacG/DUF329 family)
MPEPYETLSTGIKCHTCGTTIAFYAAIWDEETNGYFCSQKCAQRDGSPS